jgi:chromosome segregation ATPase
VQKDKDSEELRLQSDLAELTEKLETANYRILELSSNEEKLKVYQ